MRRDKVKRKIKVLKGIVMFVLVLTLCLQQKYLTLQVFAVQQTEYMEMMGVFHTKPMIAAAESFTIALRNDGTVWSWGQNWSGGLGSGCGIHPCPPNSCEGGYRNDHREVPGPVQGMNNVVSIAASRYSAMALRDDGTVWTWGMNRRGHVDPPNVHSEPGNAFFPVQVAGFSNDVVDISAGDNHYVALMRNGTVWSWGSNSDGQLSTGCRERFCQFTPVQAQGINDVVAIAAGTGFTIALTSAGNVYMWGFNIGRGSRDTHIPQFNLSPVRQQGFSNNVKAIAAGGNHAVALRNDGTVWSWGSNDWGQLGSGTTSSLIPVRANINNISSITAAGASTTAICTANTMWSWGDRNLSDGNRVPRSPIQEQNMNGIGFALSCRNRESMSRTYVIKNDGNVWTWGRQRLANGNSVFNSMAWQLRGYGNVGYFNLGTFDGSTQQPEGITINVDSYGYYTIFPQNAGMGWIGYDNTLRFAFYFINPATITVNLPNPSWSYAITTSNNDQQVHVIITRGSVEHRLFSPLFSRPSNEYNHNLAIWSAHLSAMAYDRYAISHSLALYGFNDIWQGDYGGINLDRAAHTIAHKELFVNGAYRNLIVVVVRGTPPSIAEWACNIVGSIDGLIGGRHSGFKGIAEIINRNLLSYMDRHTHLFGNSLILITGHSRGGSAANILAEDLINMPEHNRIVGEVFSYTFAAANTTGNIPEANGIFNILNSRDPIMAGAGRFSAINMYGEKFVITMDNAPDSNAHSMATYIQWLESHSGLTYWEFRELIADDPFHSQLAIANCPVDIVVSDGEGRFVAAIIDEVPINTEGNDVLAFVVEGVKYVFIPSGGNYNMRFTPTNYGTMTFSVETIDAFSETPITRRFENVSLVMGRVLSSKIVDTPVVRLLITEDDRFTYEVLEDGTEIPFVVLGDINGDGNVNILDLQLLLRHVSRRNILTDERQLLAADVNRDGNVDILDLRLLLQYVSRRINSFN